MTGNEAAQYLSSLWSVQQLGAAVEPNDVKLLQSYSLAYFLLGSHIILGCPLVKSVIVYLR